MTPWLVVLAAGVGSYLLRISMVVAIDRIRSTARLERVSTFAVPSAFAALAAAAVVAGAGGAGVEAIPPLGAVTVAGLAAWRTRSSYAAIAAGMPTLWALTAVLGG